MDNAKSKNDSNTMNQFHKSTYNKTSIKMLNKHNKYEVMKIFFKF